MGEKRTHRTGTRTVLDTAQRKLRLKRFIESLDKDNFQEDINISTARLPAFEEKPVTKKRKKTTKRRFPKSFQALLEDPVNSSDVSQYNSAQVPVSRIPARNFCSVCGYRACYKCIVCGTKYCCLKCGQTHSETRCLKWA
ncbi:zinc finger HIT domain-containing protein 1-like [Bolinopsis microptera]|uniref:zinc finger HIT domain-containing protein 1-like n=1 Tax=Bolinopsis microptera TaxID=2820187 RepID=UPI00307AD336